MQVPPSAVSEANEEDGPEQSDDAIPCIKEDKMKEARKSNPRLRELIVKLKELARKENVRIWNRLALDLEKPSRQRRIINIDKLEKHTKENESIVIPGKVLASGDLSHKLNIAAFRFSHTAIEKIKQSNGNYLSIEELMQKNPKGKGLKIIG